MRPAISLAHHPKTYSWNLLLKAMGIVKSEKVCYISIVKEKQKSTRDLY